MISLSLTEHTEISEGSKTKTPAVMELDNQSLEDRFEASWEAFGEDNKLTYFLLQSTSH
jgi:hypothetical protein